jgi:hypothetical protein
MLGCFQDVSVKKNSGPFLIPVSPEGGTLEISIESFSEAHNLAQKRRVETVAFRIASGHIGYKVSEQVKTRILRARQFTEHVRLAKQFFRRFPERRGFKNQHRLLIAVVTNETDVGSGVKPSRTTPLGYAATLAPHPDGPLHRLGDDKEQRA